MSLSSRCKGLVVLLAAAWGGWYWIFIMQRSARINTLNGARLFGRDGISTALSWITARSSC
jgi:hypothetical protein